MRLFPGGRLFRVRLYSLERMCGFLARYIARRLGLMVLLLFGVSLMVFLISHLVPSDPVGANLSATAQNNPEVVAAFKAKWGLDKPLVQQYFIYVGNLLKGDMGQLHPHREAGAGGSASVFPRDGGAIGVRHAHRHCAGDTLRRDIRCLP